MQHIGANTGQASTEESTASSYTDRRTFEALFERKSNLIAINPAAEDIALQIARDTDPVLLYPGAKQAPGHPRRALTLMVRHGFVVVEWSGRR